MATGGTLGRKARPRARRQARAPAKARDAGLRQQLGEARARQAATDRILKVIARSPSDVQPVFDAMVRSALRLIDGHSAVVTRMVGDMLHLGALTSTSKAGDAALRKTYPREASKSHFHWQAIQSRSPIFIVDTEKASGALALSKKMGRARGYRSVLVVPLLREGSAVGTISVTRREPGSFTEHQSGLLKTFADQAVIAIENVRRFTETKEALERQTATAEILKVMASSPSDVQPVFDKVAERASLLCDAPNVTVWLADGEVLRTVATHWREPGAVPLPGDSVPISRTSVSGTAILERRTVHIEDVTPLLATEYSDSSNRVRRLGVRAIVAVPMIREGRAIGTLALWRREAARFSDAQIALLETFADQAVIAIENVRLFNETKEGLEQQTAISEILRIISSSPADVRPMLDAVTTHAARICDASDARIFLVDGARLRHAAGFGDVPVSSDSFAIDRGTASGRAVIDRVPLQIADILAESPDEYPGGREHHERSGWRTVLAVPLLREDRALGVILLRRMAVRPFTEKQVTLLKTFADQAAIAIENVRLFNETKEALERQTATGEILKVISSSPTDIQPVLDAVAGNAAQICGASDAVVFRIEGDALRQAAHHGQIPNTAQTLPISRGSATGRCVVDRQAVHIHDLEAESEAEFPIAKSHQNPDPHRTILAVPLLRVGVSIGAIAIRRKEVRPFSEKQVELLKTFAAQAVIAIENVRLFNETREALERQTATAEILKVIASSPSDVQPVLDAICASAARLTGALAVTVLRFEAGMLLLGAHTSVDAASDQVIRGSYPLPISQSPYAVRVLESLAPVEVPDVEQESDERIKTLAHARGWRSILIVPLIREGVVVGTVNITRKESGSFPAHQVDVVKTFASQAVIAIENVRLFKELEERNRDVTEALERQTATAEILKVIASSPSDVQPVLNTVAASAARLCAATDAVIHLRDGENLRCSARHGRIETAMQIGETKAISPRWAAGRAALEGRQLHITDMLAEAREFPDSAEMARRAGHRTLLVVPMLREGMALGTIAIRRSEVRPFTDKQVALLKTFADQAVIAIENARLFNETKEALERQTATAEILEVISSSPTDVQPVLDAVAERAGRICDGRFVDIFMVDRGELRLRAWYGELARLESNEALPLSRETVTGRAVIDREPVHVLDLMDAPVEEFPRGRELALRFGHRTTLAVPLMRENEALGGILMRRTEVRPFSERQIALLKTFASQAAIAIENVRLFNETKEALERQTATAEILKVISESPTNVQPVFDAIVNSAVRLFEPWNASIAMRDGDLINLRAAASPRVSRMDLREVAKHFPMPFDPKKIAVARVIAERRAVENPDTEAPEVSELSRKLARAAGYRSAVAVPLVRENEGIGAIVLTHPQPGLKLSERQLALVRTFADQAVIAIENVRLFNETKEALERQTATAEILEVIARSPGDVQPVFETIARNATRLCGGGYSVVTRFDGKLIHLAATSELSAEGRKAISGAFPTAPSARGSTSRAILTGSAVHVPDVREDPHYEPGGFADRMGVRSIFAVPLMHFGAPIGAISVSRARVGTFSQSQISLLRTFTDQAVIAIENVRLFNETKEALERQTATAEILKVISGSPTNTQPVFDTIVRNFVALSGGAFGAVFRYEGGLVHYAGSAGFTSAQRESVRTKYPVRVDDPSVLSSRVILAKAPIHIQDVRQDPQYDLGHAATAGWRRMLAVPMLRDGEPLGSIVAAWTEAGATPRHHEDLLKTFADQAVIAIENVRLFKELQRRTEALTKSVGQLTALGEVGQAISSTLDLETVLQTIVSRAVQLTGLDGGSIYEYDEQTEEFRLQAGENMAAEVVEEVRRTPVRKGEGAIGTCAVTREPVLVPDIGDPGFPSARKGVLVRAGYRAILAVPLLREDHMLGALQVFRKTPGAFATEVVELLKTFATQSALAIQNARLFREIAEKGRQLEEASQHKSNFLASMSHELRTPLNAILGLNEMLLGQIYGDVPADMQPPLAQIQASGKHLLRLINNVLDLAKIEAGRMELSLSDYSVQDTVASVQSTLSPLAAEKGLEFLGSAPNDIPLAYGDGGRITQCLMNLAGNSLKFTKAGRVEISVAEQDGLLTYRVADTGIGIPPDKIGSLFTEFKQTDATIASEYGGTGLGLSISRKFVEMHGGRIWVESEPGKGSAFIFEIPLRVNSP